MKNELLLSVVVPVYNAKKTLNRCVDSILKQTLKDMEIILVDDGSTDGTYEICDNYERKHKCIHVLHQRNKGPLSARVAGCKIAKGKYISFVDSDDWVEENMFEVLCQEIEDADILASGIIRTSEDGSINRRSLNLCPQGEYSMDDTNFVSNVLFQTQYTKGSTAGAFLDGPYSKIFKRDIVSKILDKADVYIREFEDWMFTSLYILRCKKIRISNYCFYHYVSNPDSIGHTVNRNFLRQQNMLYDIMSDAIKGHLYESVLLVQLQRKILSNLMHTGRIMGFEEGVLLPIYFFPNNKMLKSNNVVLFGAGMVGQSYNIDWHNKKINVVLWIDNSTVNIKQFGMSPANPNKILEIDFDYVVCAIREKTTAEEMKTQLIGLGVDEEKILWEEPICIINDCFYNLN